MKIRIRLHCIRMRTEFNVAWIFFSQLKNTVYGIVFTTDHKISIIIYKISHPANPSRVKDQIQQLNETSGG